MSDQSESPGPARAADAGQSGTPKPKLPDFLRTGIAAPCTSSGPFDYGAREAIEKIIAALEYHGLIGECRDDSGLRRPVQRPVRRPDRPRGRA